MRTRSLKQWKQGGSFSRKRNYVLTVAAQDPGENSVAAVVFTNARASTTPVRSQSVYARRHTATSLQPAITSV